MFSLINYKASFFPASPAGDNQIRIVQAADAPTMEAAIAKALAEIVAINATVPPLPVNPPTPGGLDTPPWPADPFTNGNKFVLSDVSLAGGGDGHTFIFNMQFSRFAMTSFTLLSQFLAGFLPSSDNAGTQVLNYSGNPPFGLINVDMNGWFDEIFDPSLLKFKACLASDGAHMQAAYEDMVVRLRAAFPNLDGVLTAPFSSMAGAAKGTQFMAVTGGYQT